MTATGIRRGCLSIAQRLFHRSGSQAACSNATALRSQTASLSTTSGDPSAQREEEITQLLKERMPGAKAVRVQDTSGGCGSMYRIAVAADEFKGLSVVKQHQLVTKALEEEIATWHGFVLETKPT